MATRKVEFRCPHTKGTFKPREREDGTTLSARQVRLEARRERYEITDAEWTPVMDVQMDRLTGPKLVPTGSWQTVVTCPECGDKRRVVTDRKMGKV
jgi:hypothetical protein